MVGVGGFPPLSSQSSAHYVSVLCLVLSDPQSRAVYDIFGKKGLEVEGWEVRLENHRNERSEIPNCRNGCMGCKWLSVLGFFIYLFIFSLGGGEEEDACGDQGRIRAPAEGER